MVTTGALLSIAGFRDGRQAQEFPSFGSERTGAPVVAFCQLADGSIRLREPVMAPDALIVQDATMLHQVDVFAGLRPDGFLLVNGTLQECPAGAGPAPDGRLGHPRSRKSTMITRFLAGVAHAAPRERRPFPAPGEPMRILIGADTYPPDINGAAQFAARLARGLVGRGHEVHVICPARPGGPRREVSGDVTVHRVRSVPMPLHRTMRTCAPWVATRAADRLIEQLGPDVVHVQSSFAVGRAVLRSADARGIPTVATNHVMPENLLGYVPGPRWLGPPIGRLVWSDIVRVYGRARVVTAPSPHAVDLLRAHGLGGTALAVSCGVDIAAYESQLARPVAVPPVVLFVGRLDPEKNVDQLVRAVAGLPDVTAEIIGDGRCREDLEALARRLGAADRIRFRGTVPFPTLVRAYQRCDMFCMPGTAELQSLVTMEAMAAGLPIVAADASALPHLVMSGVNGFLFRPGDIGDLGTRIADLARRPQARAEAGRNSRRLIAGHALDFTLDAYEQVYAAAAGEGETVGPGMLRA